MTITLPRASASSTGASGRRRGGRRLPDAGDVPQVRAASDPGVNVPDFSRYAGGLGEVGAAITGVSDALSRELKKQQIQHDATIAGNASLDWDRWLAEDLRDRSVKDNPARPNFMDDYERAAEAELKKRMGGLEGISEEARERLQLRMRGAMSGQIIAAGKLSLDASKDAANDTMAAITRQSQAQAARNPDSIGAILDQLDDDLAPFRGSMTANEERDAILKARQSVILGAVEGYVLAERFEDVNRLMASGVFDEDLTREQRINAENMITHGEARSVAASEKMEKAEEKELTEAREFNAAKRNAGIVDGSTTQADLDADLDDRLLNGIQHERLTNRLAASLKEGVKEDDPNIVLSLTKKADEGTLTLDDVYDAYPEYITRERMDAFRSDIQGAPDDIATRRQRQTLRENIGGLNEETLDAGTLRRINAAVDEFNERTTGPNREDPLKVRKEIEADFDALPAPEDLPGSRFIRDKGGSKSDRQSMDMGESRLAVGMALAFGKITPQEAKKEIYRLQKLEAARQRQP